MLSALVVHKEIIKPGQGFFTFARSLDLFAGNGEDKFYIEECAKFTTIGGLIIQIGI